MTSSTEENTNQSETRAHPRNIESPSKDVYIRSVSRTLSTENSTLLLQPAMRLTIANCKTAFNNRNVICDILAILFGIGSWIGINSLFLQLPLLVSSAPEGWDLPSYLVLIIQMGNIGPVLYSLIHRSFPNRVKDSYMIYFVLAIGSVAILLTSLFYKETVTIGEKETSLPLFILVFFIALVGCTSSVLFMPYMGRFREIYLVTYLIGEGLSGFLPSVVALAQGVGGNSECIATNTTNGTVELVQYNPPPRFGTSAFFVFVFITFLFSTMAFSLLDNLKMFKGEHAVGVVHYGNNYKYETNAEADAEKHVKKLSKSNYIYLLALMGIVCVFGNGVFPSIQSYSCLPYGNMAYHFTVTLSSIANPLACFLAVFVRHTSIRMILYLCGIGLVFAAYCIATSLMSPDPPLRDTTIGNILVVFAWTILIGIVSYIKLGITAIFRFQGGKSLVWTGSVAQFGSFIGAIITFCLINYTSLFSQYYPC